MKNYITIDDLADRVPISKSHLYALTSTRKIPHLKVGRRVLFDPEVIEKWMASHLIEVKGVSA